MCYNTRMDKRTDGQQREPELESTHVTLPPGLKREAKIKAIREGKSLSKVIRELLAEYVQK